MRNGYSLIPLNLIPMLRHQTVTSFVAWVQSARWWPCTTSPRGRAVGTTCPRPWPAERAQNVLPIASHMRKRRYGYSVIPMVAPTTNRNPGTKRPNTIIDEAVYDRMARAHNPFGDGQAARRILELLAG